MNNHKLCCQFCGHKIGNLTGTTYYHMEKKTVNSKASHLYLVCTVCHNHPTVKSAKTYNYWFKRLALQEETT